MDILERIERWMKERRGEETEDAIDLLVSAAREIKDLNAKLDALHEEKAGADI